ncbi:MAG TPA: LacI family DNA-binding transcriptional regulator [Cellulomonas sp.]
MARTRRSGATPARATIADIARLAGVSPTAVSFALNDRPGISEETRRRILDAVAELNWRPSLAARTLTGMRSDTVGLVVARPARTLGIEPFFAQLLSGLQARLSLDLVALHQLVVEDVATEVEVYHRWAAEQRVDGLVVLDLEIDDPRPAVLHALGLPAVVLGGTGEPGPLPAVWVDDYAAMAQVAEHLAALGHRRVGHVGGIADYEHSVRRVAALRDASQRLGLTVEQEQTDYSDSASAAATRRLLGRPVPPTAIVFDSDVAALAGLGVASALGVRVPADLSVVSFDDSELARLVHPPLTALSRDTHALGVLVADTLLALVAGQDVPPVVQAPAPVLAPRASTAAPRG